MPVSKADALREAKRLDRTIGYPSDDESLGRLVESIAGACNRYQVSVARVISEAVALSKYCPTDFDLLNIAKSCAPVEYVSVYTPHQIAQLRAEFQSAGYLDLLQELNQLWGPA